ncbi:hypothetical protein [Methylosinus sp. Ce-a6]|uniref:hypothetical protein n=1 Tax=Methylosinus sp. Ce-a6 TaxID=2172005 RepID=UPI00135B24C7|nr:hypothetical protein [Methylosinus sp. Ce-a6]
MFGWWSRRREYRALVQRDADDLMARFGIQAYAEASMRWRMDTGILDGNRPDGHWQLVQEEIAERTGRIIGLSGYEQYGRQK